MVRAVDGLRDSAIALAHEAAVLRQFALCAA